MAEAPTQTVPMVPAELDADVAFDILTVEQAAEILFTSNLDYVRGIIESGELVTFAQEDGTRRLYREVVTVYKRYREAVQRAALREMMLLGEETGGYDRDYSFLLEDEETENDAP